MFQETIMYKHIKYKQINGYKLENKTIKIK